MKPRVLTEQEWEESNQRARWLRLTQRDDLAPVPAERDQRQDFGNMGSEFSS